MVLGADIAPVPNTGSRVPIVIRNVSKVFGEDGDRPFAALKQVSASIAPGEFISVVGDIVVGGTPVTKPITDVGIAFQDHLLLDFRTAFDNVMLHADIRRLPRKDIAQRATELFAQLQLDHAKHKYPRQLSGGMRQRVSLIRTLVHDPSVLLMDEPFGALDALTRAHLQDSVMEIHARLGNTVMMITHDVDEAVLLSDRVVMMTNGPSATIGEILKIDLPRPRRRLELATDAEYARCRAAILEFLYARHRVPARAAA